MEPTTSGTVADSNHEERKPLTRRLANLLVKKVWGPRVRIRYQPLCAMPYAIVARQPGTTVLAVVAEGLTPDSVVQRAAEAFRKVQLSRQEVSK